MRPFTSTIPFAEALALVTGAAIPIARVEAVPLAAADGRVVAAEVVASRDVPPFDRAAMDGYAVRAVDTAGASAASPATLACVDRVFTGQMPSRLVGPDECIEIATGAPMPGGADAVVMVEETERVSGDVLVKIAVHPRQNVGRRAADIATGRVVVPAGAVLNPSRIGAIASLGVETVDVYARPSVAVISTGNEIAEPGRPLAAGQIYDVNRFTIAAVVGRHGGVAASVATAGDSIEDLVRTIDAVRGHDIIVFSGGSSVGDRDLMLDALRRRGTVIFHGVAVKPGKPTAFGRVDGTPVFGMPGYPSSCLSNAYMLLVPLLRATARIPPWKPETLVLPLAARVVSAAGRHQFYTVRVVNGRAEPAFKASGDITSMADADGYIEIEAGVDAVEAGAMVTVRLF